MDFDPTTDLEITRHLAAPPAKVWRCWTEPALFARWWTPPPVTVREVTIDPRPGGLMHTVMVMPDGNEHAFDACYLEVMPDRRLVWTDALIGGFRPAPSPMFAFTAIISMQPEGAGTQYSARAMHKNRDTRNRHEEMGFFDGWGQVTQQLEKLAITL